MQSSRLALLSLFIVVLTLLLLYRLAYLQITQYKRYHTLSLNNQLSITPIAPPRGVILDRNGVLLAENIPIYVLEIIPERVKDSARTIAQLQKILPSISSEDIDNFNRARHHNRSFIPIPLKLKLTQEEVAIFALHQYQFKGVSVKARLMRFYPLGELTAHILGYVGRINIKELQSVNSSNYRATNFIGKTGIEQFYEDSLHGIVGYQQIETDVSGRTIRVIKKQNPIPGKKLLLTIDIRLQQAAYTAMHDRRGAVVLMSTHSGEILAMVSSPSFNPNIFVNGINAENYRKLTMATDKPLYNRAVRGLYPPASTIKPFIALAGLEKNVVDKSSRIFDPGWFKLPHSTHAYRDWRKSGHGSISMIRAITVSCDTYFYQLGQKLGIAAIEEVLNQFGFGQLTHVDLNEEASGLLPSPRWKRTVKKTSWYPGDTLITSIGQGFMLASPLQLANATVALARQGIRFRPHLLYKTLENSDKTEQLYPALEDYPIRLRDDEIWNTIQQGMQNVITSHEGTGHRFGRKPPYSVAAKTGTAQVFGGKKYDKQTQSEMSEYLRDHSLFIAYAPVESPEVSIAVIVENDVIAASVAREVLDVYFNLKQGTL